MGPLTALLLEIPMTPMANRNRNHFLSQRQSYAINAKEYTCLGNAFTIRSRLQHVHEARASAFTVKTATRLCAISATAHTERTSEPSLAPLLKKWIMVQVTYLAVSLTLSWHSQRIILM